MLSTLLIVLSVGLFVTMYMVMFAITGYLLMKGEFKENKLNQDFTFAWIAGFFWPVSLPIWLVTWPFRELLWPALEIFAKEVKKTAKIGAVKRWKQIRANRRSQ